MNKRENLKVIVSTSRHIDIIKFSQILPESDIISIPIHKIPLSIKSLAIPSSEASSRSFLPPVLIWYLSKISLFALKPRIYYLEKPTFDYISKAVETVISVHFMSKTEGDIQVFLVTSQDIKEFQIQFEVSVWIKNSC
jgi:HrpA-like RNA helicase